MLGFLGKIVGGAAKVFTVGRSIITAALPILKALRPAVDEVDEAFTYIEEKIAAGGEAADDFLDANIDLIEKIHGSLGDAVVYLLQAQVVTGKLITYSQEQSPDTITDAEAIDLGRELVKFRELAPAFRASSDAAMEAAASFTGDWHPQKGPDPDASPGTAPSLPR